MTFRQMAARTRQKISPQRASIILPIDAWYQRNDRNDIFYWLKVGSGWDDFGLYFVTDCVKYWRGGWASVCDACKGST